MKTRITEAQWHGVVQSCYPRECERYGTEEVALFIDLQDGRGLDLSEKVHGLMKRFPLSPQEYRDQERQDEIDEACVMLLDPPTDEAVARVIAKFNESVDRRAAWEQVERKERQKDMVTAAMIVAAILALIVAITVPLRSVLP